jgi:hypothetical protein
MTIGRARIAQEAAGRKEDLNTTWTLLDAQEPHYDLRTIWRQQLRPAGLSLCGTSRRINQPIVVIASLEA